MITTFRIQGFKCFIDLELSRLSRITLLGGRNNAGKSSVLEALFMFLDRANPNMITRQYVVRGVTEVPLTPEGIFTPIFTDYDVEKKIRLTATVDDKTETMDVNFNPKYGDVTVPAEPSIPGQISPGVIRTDEVAMRSAALDIRYTKDGEKDHVTHLTIAPSGLSLKIDYLSTIGVPRAALVPARMRPDTNDLARRFGELDISGRSEEIAKFLQIIEPGLKGLSSIHLGKSSVIHGDIGLAKKIPIAYMGDGVFRLLEIILLMATNQNGLIMIDEVENGIHHSVMPEVWKAIASAARKYHCQVIATTHSYECLQAAHEGLSDSLSGDLSYIRLDRTETDINAKYYDHGMLGTALLANLELR